MTRVFPVDEVSRVAEIRRAANAMAHQEGLDEILAGNAALIATEVGTNLLKHATGGEIYLSSLSDRTGPGIEILGIDKGPGMTNVAECLADGYSSARTSGTGLGAVSRLSQEFDIYSEKNKGTVLVSQVRKGGGPRTTAGAVLKPFSGEETAGDAWAFSERDGAVAVMVADGLGHGLMAARASNEAVSAFRRASDLSPVSVLQQVHAALRSTRGAAVAVAHLNIAQATLKFAGIGNIAGVIAGADKSQFMVSHSGTAGYNAPRIREFSYSLPEDALIVMHSDGLVTNWNLNDHPGLRRRHPSVIAGVLGRDATRNRDDLCVVVIRSPKGQ